MMREAGEVTYTDAHQRMVSILLEHCPFVGFLKILTIYFFQGKNRGEVCFTNTDDLHSAKRKFDGTEINGRK